MSLGCVLFFVLGEWLFFYVFLLIGKCLFLNIIKVSWKWKFFDYLDDKGFVILYWLWMCIWGFRNGWSNLLERVIEERENKKIK